MARLSHTEISQLVDRLTREPADSTIVRNQEDDRLRQAVASLAASGDLGPLLGRALAAYLNHPVRCTSGDPGQNPAERTTYLAREGSGFWISIDTMLAATIADAMIGGDGNPARIGVGAKAARVAAGAAAQLLTAISSAVDAPPPGRVECEPPAEVLGLPLGGGSMIVGANEFGWMIGMRRAPLAPVARADGSEHAPRRPAIAHKSPPVVAQRGSLAGALEAARAACERSLKAPVVFGAMRSERQTQPLLPAGCISVGVPAPPGTAILSIDERTASALLHAMTHGEGNRNGELGLLARTGVETIATDLLHAFVDALVGTEPSARRALRLTEAAILAATPHDAIEHDVDVAGLAGRFRWLIPSDLTRSRV